jgi:hypothetical protein
MKTSTIRDGRGQITGSVTRFNNGDEVARDKSGSVQGRSSEKYGNTRDSSGRIVSNDADARGLLKKK